jgi:hypothetical protein
VAAFLDRLIDRPRPTGLLKSALQHFYGVFWIWILRFRLGFWEFIGIGLHAVSCLRPRLTGPASRWSLWLTWKRERIGLIFTDETRRAWANRHKQGGKPGCPSFVAFSYFLLLLHSRPSMERLRMPIFFSFALLSSRFRVLSIEAAKTDR